MTSDFMIKLSIVALSIVFIMPFLATIIQNPKAGSNDGKTIYFDCTKYPYTAKLQYLTPLNSLRFNSNVKDYKCYKLDENKPENWQCITYNDTQHTCIQEGLNCQNKIEMQHIDYVNDTYHKDIILQPYGNFIIQKELPLSVLNNLDLSNLTSTIEINNCFQKTNLIERCIENCPIGHNNTDCTNLLTDNRTLIYNIGNYFVNATWDATYKNYNPAPNFNGYDVPVINDTTNEPIYKLSCEQYRNATG